MRYICTVCGYVYDEAKEQVPFESLPDIWKCPICRAPKSAFEPEEEPVPAETSPAIAESAAENSAAEEVAVEPVADEWISKIGESDLKKLSPGQLSALCSNLARGCEKQYKPEESKLFKQLSDYFASVTPAVNDASVEGIAAMLQSDIANYKGVRATADAADDRGAARISVWGEKVTRMLSSLASRYIEEGEAMLADTGVWVCTACGFVYIGDEAPDLCPVCKVPAWKFEEIQGR